jgi:hypothetical protein
MWSAAQSLCRRPVFCKSWPRRHPTCSVGPRSQTLRQDRFSDHYRQNPFWLLALNHHARGFLRRPTQGLGQYSCQSARSSGTLRFILLSTGDGNREGGGLVTTFLDSLDGQFWADGRGGHAAKVGMCREFTRAWQQKLADNSGWREQVTPPLPRHRPRVAYPAPASLILWGHVPEKNRGGRQRIDRVC